MSAKADSAGGAARPRTNSQPGVTGPRLLGTLAIAAVTFSQVCGSPLGIEAAVGAGGAFGFTIALVLGMLIWAIPQSLIVAELSSAFPAAGGTVGWVEEGLGDILGFINAAMCQLSSIAALSVYPALVADTVVSIWPEAAGPVPAALLRVGVMALTVGINIWGDYAMAFCTEWLSAAILLPFLAFPLVIFAMGTPMSLTALGPAGMPVPFTSFYLLLNSIIWNLSAWDQVGALAANAKDPATTYPAGIALAVATVGASYAWPVLWGYAAVPVPGMWVSGSFPAIAKAISPAFGLVLLAAAAASGISQAISAMACNARQLQAAAAQGTLPLPKFLAWTWGVEESPVIAIAVLTALSLPLTYLHVDALIGLDITTTNLGTLCFTLAFLRLKYTAPHRARPYVVPGGLFGAWAVSLPVIAIILMSLISVTDGGPGYTLPILIGTPFVLFLLALVRQSTCPVSRAPPTAEHEHASEQDAEGAKAADALTGPGQGGEPGGSDDAGSDSQAVQRVAVVAADARWGAVVRRAIP